MGKNVKAVTEVHAHSPIGASSMYIWSVCPAAIRLSKGIKSPTSSYALEGTKAHDSLAGLLEGKIRLSDVEPDHKEAVLLAFDALRTLIAQAGAGAKYWVEHRFDLSSVHEGCFGTADFVLYSPKTRTLTVCDYKHGQGILVEVENNLQLQYYGLGALKTLEDVGDIETVRLMIIQPRCPHPSGQFIRSWDIDALSLYEFSADLADFAKKTEDPNAEIVPGDHCRFCNAAPVCPELHKKAVTLAKEAFTEVREDRVIRLPKTMKEVSQAMKWVPTLEAWAKSVRNYAYAEAVHGGKVEGFKLVEKRPIRRWKDEKETISYLAEKGLSDEEIYAPQVVKSPAQLEKTLHLTKTEQQQIAHLIEKKSSGVALVHDSDRRTQVTLGKLAAKEFKELSQGEAE